MGPFRLNSLLKNRNISASFEDINFEDAANEWSSKGGQRKIVLDGLNFARKFYDPDEREGSDVICNGEYKKIAENMKTLIQAFKDVSIELVFFFDGPVDETKLESWIQRRVKKLARYSDTLKHIESKSISELRGDVFPCMILPVMKEVLKEEKISIVRGVDDHDKEMAKYVIDEKCVGILSDDTDFVVFQGIPYVFSASECLDLKRMKTKLYCRQRFLEGTKMKPEAMPIFATLLGNDYIKKEDAVAYSLRKFGTIFLQPHQVRDLAELANRIYNESSTQEERAERLAVETKQDSTLILNSLRSYDLDISTNVNHSTGDSPWDLVVALCHEKFREGLIENQTLSIVKRQMCFQSEKFEDPQNSHVDVLGGLRQRIYSILLLEKPSNEDKVTVTEILAGGTNSMKRISVPLLNVDVDHPGIFKLWKCGEDLSEKRWALVWWALRSNSTGETVIPFEALSTLRRLPDHLILVALVLLFLEKVVQQISEKEKIVLMVLATSVPQMDVSQLSKNCVARTTKRAVNLATLYMQTYVYVRWVTDACGLQLDAKSRDAYSGQLFHYLFQLNDPEQFFQQSEKAAREKYTELRNTLNLVQQVETVKQLIPIPTSQPASTANSVSPVSSDQNAGTKQEGEAKADRKEEKRYEEKKEERKTTDSRRERESPDQRRERRRQDWHDKQRRDREDNVWQHRHQGERDRNYRRRYASDQPRRGFNRGRREHNNRYRGSDRPRTSGSYNGPRHSQNYRRNRRDFSKRN